MPGQTSRSGKKDVITFRTAGTGHACIVCAELRRRGDARARYDASAIQNAFIVNGAPIPTGTLNVSETIGLAQTSAMSPRALHRRPVPSGEPR
jgi:hypothetical protein